MKKFFKISILPILLFGFAQDAFACGGRFDFSEFAFIFGFPLLIIIPLAFLFCFIISKIEKRKNIFYFASLVVLSILYGYMAYRTASGILCGTGDF